MPERPEQVVKAYSWHSTDGRSRALRFASGGVGARQGEAEVWVVFASHDQPPISADLLDRLAAANETVALQADAIKDAIGRLAEAEGALGDARSLIHRARLFKLYGPGPLSEPWAERVELRAAAALQAPRAGGTEEG